MFDYWVYSLKLIRDIFSVNNYHTKFGGITRKDYLQEVIVGQATTMKVVEVLDYLLAFCFMRFTKSELSQKPEHISRWNFIVSVHINSLKCRIRLKRLDSAEPLSLHVNNLFSFLKTHKEFADHFRQFKIKLRVCFTFWCWRSLTGRNNCLLFYSLHIYSWWWFNFDLVNSALVKTGMLNSRNCIWSCEIRSNYWHI